VRIDAFPLVIGALKSEGETITIPGDPLANWACSDAIVSTRSRASWSSSCAPSSAAGYG